MQIVVATRFLYIFSVPLFTLRLHVLEEIILVTGSAAGCEVTGEANVQEELLSRQRLRQLLELLFKISD